MVGKIIGGAVLALVAASAYLAFAPAPIAAVAWQAPVDAGYTGAYAPNDRLGGLRRIDLAGETGPEHVAIGPDGMLYAAVAGGRILRMQPDGSNPQVWAATGGRVLGFDFDPQGRMIAADSRRGLLMIERQPDGAHIAQLAQHVPLAGGRDPIRFADAVVVARDGKIYFTDASRRFGAAQWGEFEASVLDIMEHSATGRVLVYDPASARVEVLAEGLSFANGVALSADERSLFVAETGAYRVWKLSAAARGLRLGAAAQPEARVVLDNLPGYPDNLMRGQQGRIWVGLVKPRSATADRLADSPRLRTATFRLPRALWPVPRPYGHVLAITEDGAVQASLQDPAGRYPETTGVTETADRLYIQSLHADALGWRPKEGLGL